MLESDVVVVGAGHNALVSAAYLSLAGLKVVVLEAQAQPGGNTMTEELTLPGFKHDSCSTAHTLIQANPLMQKDELRLSAYGLRYLLPDPVFVVPFENGESLTMYRDLEKTVAEIDRFSPTDGKAYRQLLSDWEGLRPLQATERNQPPLTPEDSAALWRSGALGDEGLRIRLASGLQIIQERFENPYVQTFIAWVAMMTMEPLDHPYTGILPFSLTAGRQQHSWAIPEGGSGSLVRALRQVIESNGGTIVCDSRVESIETEGERAKEVVTAAGERYRAEQAILSTAHVKQFPSLLGGNVDEEIVSSIDHWEAGLTMFVNHYALSEAPRYRTWNGDTTAVAMGTLQSIENLHQFLANFRSGRLHLDHPFTLCLNASLVDPARAPTGHHTLKVISVLPYELQEGPQHWDTIKRDVSDNLLETYLGYTVNLTPGHVLASQVESPLDLERRNANNYRGSCHGGSSRPSQTGWFRPAPAWNGYRSPIPGFYLTGACTHPGGSVSGFPGRNAARTIIEDLGLSWDELPSRAAEVAQSLTTRAGAEVSATA